MMRLPVHHIPEVSDWDLVTVEVTGVQWMQIHQSGQGFSDCPKWACANCSFGFQLLADRSGTRCCSSDASKLDGFVCSEKWWIFRAFCAFREGLRIKHMTCYTENFTFILYKIYINLVYFSQISLIFCKLLSSWARNFQINIKYSYLIRCFWIFVSKKMPRRFFSFSLVKTSLTGEKANSQKLSRMSFYITNVEISQWNCWGEVGGTKTRDSEPSGRPCMFVCILIMWRNMMHSVAICKIKNPQWNCSCSKQRKKEEG